MAIERWEMLLSTRADRYILKIRGPRAEVEKIVMAHSRVCQEPQEISDAVFQWVIFVVDATQSERLAIQNQLMAMTADTAPRLPSVELDDVLSGLSDALGSLTNLTADEQKFVEKKIKEVQAREVREAREAAASLPASFAAPPAAPNPAMAPRAPLPPAAAPPPPVVPQRPAAPAPPPLWNPAAVPPVPVPVARPPAPPPVAPPPPVPRPPVAPPVPISNPAGMPPPAARPPLQPPVAPPAPPRVPPLQPGPSVTPGIELTPAPRNWPTNPIPEIEPMTPTVPAGLAATPPPPGSVIPGELVLDLGFPPSAPPVPPAPTVRGPVDPLSEKDRRAAPWPNSIELNLPAAMNPPVAPPAPPPATYIPPPAPPPARVVPPPAEKLVFEPISAMPPTPTPPPPPPMETRPVDDPSFRAAIFYPQSGEAPKTKFLATLGEMTQKKSKKPMMLQVVHAQASTVSAESAADWIWAAKSHGADCFFVILPPDVLPDFMENVVIEARTAGIKCFLIPQGEIASRLLYMDLMVELMLIKRKPK